MKKAQFVVATQPLGDGLQIGSLMVKFDNQSIGVDWTEPLEVENVPVILRKLAEVIETKL